jgi:hypothetical protein
MLIIDQGAGVRRDIKTLVNKVSKMEPRFLTFKTEKLTIYYIYSIFACITFE